MPRAPGSVHGVAPAGRSTQLAREPVDGPKVAVVTALRDIGYRADMFDRGPEPELIRSLVLDVAFDHNGQRMEVGWFLRLSYHKKALLMLLVEATRGGRKVTDDEEIDVGEVVGRPVAVTVSSRPSNKGDGYYVNVKAATALIEGTPVPPSLQPLVRPADQPAPSFESLSEADLARIHANLVRRHHGGEDNRGAEPARDGPSAAEQPPPEHAAVTPPPAAEKGPTPLRPSQADDPTDQLARTTKQWMAVLLQQRFGIDRVGKDSARAAFWHIFDQVPEVVALRETPEADWHEDMLRAANAKFEDFWYGRPVVNPHEVKTDGGLPL